MARSFLRMSSLKIITDSVIQFLAPSVTLCASHLINGIEMSSASHRLFHILMGSIYRCKTHAMNGITWEGTLPTYHLWILPANWHSAFFIFRRICIAIGWMSRLDWPHSGDASGLDFLNSKSQVQCRSFQWLCSSWREGNRGDHKVPGWRLFLSCGWGLTQNWRHSTANDEAIVYFYCTERSGTVTWKWQQMRKLCCYWVKILRPNRGSSICLSKTYKLLFPVKIALFT